MHDLLDFESDMNSFAVIGSFAFSVPLAVLKKWMAHLMVEDELEHGVLEPWLQKLGV